MLHQPALLRSRLDRYEPHGQAPHCFTDRLGVRGIVLVALGRHFDESEPP